LQVSKVAKDQGDYALSSDLVERALFTFARASLSLFATKLSEGKARLDFARSENRELWLAGYHYIKSLMMKGTYRTALEWAKLLLSLDPEDDPYCMVLMIHNLALRAHEFEFLIRFTNHPMFGPQRPIGKHSAASLALASLNLKHTEECRKMLATAITFLPWLFCKLFQELNISDVPASVWGKLPRTDGEILFTEIYIRQTKDLWNMPEAMALLVEVAHSIQSVDVDSIEQIKDSDITLNVARYVYLDNTPALMALVPPALLHRQPNSDSDPLPPDMDENIFSHPSQRLPFLQEESRGGLGGAFAGHFDPIAALRMLVPGWTGNGGPEDEEAIDRNGLRQILDEGLGRVEANRDPATEDQSQGAGTYGLNQLSRLYRLLFGDRPSEAESLEAALVGGGDDADEMPALVDADDLSDEDEDEFYEAEWGVDDGRLHSDESDGYDEDGIDDDDPCDHR
jgi:tetratricopeptide (TPR) repeat protein